VNESVEDQYAATYRAAEDEEERIRDGTVVRGSQTADAGIEETSQHIMLYTLTSTPTSDGVSPSVWVPWSCRRMPHVPIMMLQV
jgi:hypothetical protein